MTEDEQRTWVALVVRHRRAFEAVQMIASAVAAVLELTLQAAQRELPRRGADPWRYREYE
jgi:hypothetical protein